MDEMNRDLAYRLLGAFLLGCGLVGLCFEFQKWRQEMGVTALILVSIAYGLIFFFIIFGPARLRLNRAVRDLLVASLWGLCLMCGLLTGKHGLDRWVPAIPTCLYLYLSFGNLLDRRQRKTNVPQSIEPQREQPHAR